jgi:hypothetical protein
MYTSAAEAEMYPNEVPMYTKLLIAAVLVMLATGPAAAHHSFGAEFDENMSVTLEGTVVRFEFMNPHSWR